MRFLSTVLALPIAGAWAAAPVRRQDTKVVRENVVPNSFIIEVAKANLDSVAKGIAASGGKILKTYTSDVFSGFSVESSSDNVDSLQQVAAIKKAWPVGLIQLAPVQPIAGFSDDATAPNYSAHHLTGVQELHDAGIFGKGVTVAIVDTGTAYDHPALGGGFGPGFKVAGGYDFVGETNWPYGEPKEPDSDPYDYTGHGTHVAGIVAGKSEWFTGVAPEATILSYKVFTPTGNTDDTTLIDAFLAAYEDGADIITSSIGGPSGWSTNAWAEVASRLVDLGIVVTISAGNSGYDGPFYASSGSSGTNVLAIASIDQAVKIAEPFEATFNLDGQSNTTGLAYIPGYYWFDGLDADIVPVSLDITDPAQACSPLPADTPDLTGKIALIRRGGCTFAIKQENAAAFGAEWFLFYNIPDGLLINPSSTYSLSLAMIEQKAGEAIVATYAAGGTVSAHFQAWEDGWQVGVFNAAGGVPSDFTSWGGTFDFGIKPDVGAPGREIYSTYLQGSWTTMSGTSMACPYAAGVAALYISKFGGRSENGAGFAKVLVDKIISSGAAIQWQLETPATTPIDYGYWAPPLQVGTGMINAWKVLTYETVLAFDKIAINDTRHFSRYHDVFITNTGSKPVTYTFTLQPAAGIEIQSETTPWLKYIGELEPITIVPNVSFPSGTFTVKPGQTKKAQFNFKPIQGIDPTFYPVYSGKILISGSNNEELSVPYMGAAFDVKEATRGDMFIWDTPYQFSGPGQEDITTYNSYAFNVSTQDFPKVRWELHWGTKEVRWDIYEAGWKETRWSYPPVVGENGYIGSATSYIDTANYNDFDPSFMSRDDLITFPFYDLFRTTSYSFYSHSAWWLGKLANGSYIEPGKYTMRFAALSPFGDPQHTDNWHIWATPEITVLPLQL